MLLDWNFNPLVTLYFAVWDGQGKKAVVYTQMFMRHLDTDQGTDPIKVALVGEFQPACTSARLSSQSSVLTVHPDPRKPTKLSNSKITLTRTGLQISDELSFEEWQSIASSFGAGLRKLKLKCSISKTITDEPERSGDSRHMLPAVRGEAQANREPSR